MATKRLKTNVDEIETREEMEKVIGGIADATITRDGLMAKMDAEITEIRSRYEVEITGLGICIDTLMDKAQRWAEANPDAFGDRKSIEMIHGTVGFRTGTPKLKLLSGWTWNKVLEFLVINKLTDFIRSKQDVDKELILSNRDCLKEQTLRQIGVRVVQDETFFVEPKREEAP
jgi:phage host-nuclease inhibitor protein Gam